MKRIIIIVIFLGMLMHLYPQGEKVRFLPFRMHFKTDDINLKFGYDDKNRLTGLSIVIDKGEVEIVTLSRYRFEYGTDNRVSRIEIFNDNKFTIINNIVYEKNKIYYTDDDALTSVYHFDENGRFIKMEELIDNECVAGIELTYDEAGNVIQKMKRRAFKTGNTNNIVEKDISLEYDANSKKLLAAASYPLWFIWGIDYSIFLDCPKSIKFETKWIYGSKNHDNAAKSKESVALTYSYNANGYPYLITTNNKSYAPVEIRYMEVF